MVAHLFTLTQAVAARRNKLNDAGEEFLKQCIDASAFEQAI